MIIAGYAVNADEGYIYIRGEYTLAQTRLLKAIMQAKEMGFLGQNISQLGFQFRHSRSRRSRSVCLR
jgi:NADP-reducing hydrogenase subunit HndC